jgi:hypothetical protein
MKKFDKDSFILGLMFSLFVFIVLFQIKFWFL